MAAMDDFYEPDESVDQVVSAFERGEKGVTGRPTWSTTSYFQLPVRIEQVLQHFNNKSTRELPAH